MEILLFAVIVLVVAALCAFAAEKLIDAQPYSRIIQALILIIAAILIANRAGLF